MEQNLDTNEASETSDSPREIAPWTEELAALVARLERLENIGERKVYIGPDPGAVMTALNLKLRQLADHEERNVTTLNGLRQGQVDACRALGELAQTVGQLAELVREVFQGYESVLDRVADHQRALEILTHTVEVRPVANTMTFSEPPL